MSIEYRNRSLNSGTFDMMMVTACKNSFSGFTLVEVLISSILVTICLSAVAVVTRVGTDLQVSDNNRRQARSILRSTFENDYGFRQYGAIPDSAVMWNIVNIDPRGGNILEGRLTKVTTSDSVNTVPGTRVPVKVITLTLAWDEQATGSSTVQRSITMRKILATVQ
jgi:prepilin-type N-terminal cleavage/methylation domain-containing protein